MHQGGDDLEDDFVLDIPEEDNDGFHVDDAQDFVSEEEGDSADQPEDGQRDQAGPSNAKAVEKKRKRREKLKERKKRKLTDTPGSLATVDSIAAQSTHELANYLSEMQKKSFPDMSAIELEATAVPESAIADTASWQEPRTLDKLVEFIIKAVPSLRTRLLQRSKAAGSPTLLFITGAALRVADVTRVLKDKRLRGDKGGEVAKLFAKHFKLAEHVTYLRRTKVGAAVGTPGRIGKLLCETDALTVSALSHIILDVTFRDTKRRSLLDIPETRDECMRTVLGCPQVIKQMKAGKIQVVLF
ncbi:U3-containing 90S pre-ribosomal complex subunit-domain containing protein [Desarmillaria tabescens]|uniref:U3-containing 90S pre-ribosomal complex subunit-domain containing protein n=1 Tax=Armillaria tabescens TaxID=1929756 RepID=A0AA39KE77_ARMTA|nr:U3-containing 90S pre-ribosomal complex subunit-domain containing protein [Desarmillaria tabescens]KAK0459531.1 U3-containing 90S pre-ribosomal complex subunit-domain containing protein [Desarmillaria tabescens]